MDNTQDPQKEQTRDLRFEAPTFIDPLTGIFNRYYLFQFLPEEMEKAKLGNYPLSFLMIDLDGFKKVNDTYGHLCGDEVLRQFAKIFKKRIRATDAVIRYAGDEFALLLPTADAQKARMISEQIINDVSNAEFKGPENQTLRCTLSIGFAVYPDDAIEQYKLIDLADKALYLSKHKGKNRVSYAKDVTLDEVSSLAAMDSFPCPKFIGHEQEFSKLNQIYDIVNASNTLQVACISGATGVGKSRFLGEVENSLKEKAAVIHCACAPGHTQDPYHPFAQGIGAYLDGIKIDSAEARSILSKIPFEELAELSLLIPQLAGLVERPQRAALDNKARFLLFKAFLDFISELNKFLVILVILDDVQYADRASLELLRYLTLQEKNKKIYIACSINQDKAIEIAKDSNLLDMWRQVKSSGNFTEILMDNLPAGDLPKMINTIFPNLGDNGGFVDLVYDRTRGNPCFVEEILKSLLESGMVIYQNNSWRVTREITAQDIPASLEDVVKRRVKNLDEETKEMILQAAVIGEDFNVDLLKKMGNKDEGFLFELINRAKRMRLVDERGGGKFQFANKNVQDALYNELNDAQRNDLHYKVAQTMAEQNKDNLYNVAGALAFHFGKSAQHEDALRANRVFTEMSSQLFDSYEIVESLQKLAKDIISAEEGKGIVEIGDEVRREVFKFIRALLGALKNFRLYPAHSAIRGMSSKEAYEIINDILNNKQAERIDISEVEKSLVINAKRILPKELRGTNIEDFLSIIMDRNIKTLSFTKGLPEAEMRSFIGYLSLDYQELSGLGSWADLLKKENITHIKIDEIKFTPVGAITKPGFEDKAKLQDAMLMEFLLGKLDRSALDKSGILKTLRNDPQKLAKAIMEIAENETAQGQAKDKTKTVNNLIDKMHHQVLTDQPAGNYANDFAKVILELDPGLRNKVIRSKLASTDTKEKETMKGIMSAMPDEVVVDVISEEFLENPGNLLKLREFINEVVSDEGRKKEILPKLEERLSQLNVNKEEVSFIADKLKWEELPIDKKINSLITASSEGVITFEKAKLKELLEQLEPLPKREELEDCICRLLSLAKKLDYPRKKELSAVLADFFKRDFSSAGQSPYAGLHRTECLLKSFRTEIDAEAFKILVSIFRDLINDFTAQLAQRRDIWELENPWGRKCVMFTSRFFSISQERLNAKEDGYQAVNDSLKNFILDVSRDKFLDILTYSLVSSGTHETCPIKETHQIIGVPFIDALISFGTDKMPRMTDLFKKYVFQTRIIKILSDLGSSSVDRLKAIAREALIKEDVQPAFIELLGYLKNEDLIESISPFLSFKDPVVQKAAIAALSEIATEKARGIILSIAKNDKNKSIRFFADEQLRKMQER